MITAVDTSVLLDVLTNDPRHCGDSLIALREARRLGQLVACPVVWAEVRALFADAKALATAFADAGIGFSPFDQASAELAGEAWRAYRRRGGRRHHIVADFLVAAHASSTANRLLTRDRGFYRGCFPDLKIVEP